MHGPNVSLEISFLCESLKTDLTLVGFLSGMRPLMNLKVQLPRKSLPTNAAYKFW